jgi:membrane fusion protein (multidrug efflux system)
MTAAILTDAPAKARGGPPFSRRTAVTVATAIAVAAAGGLYLTAPRAVVSTDAAYIQADSSTIAPKVRGLIAEVLVQHNQSVKRGDPLVRIDSEEFDARAASAAADLRQAQASVGAGKAAFVALDAEQQLAASNIRAAQTSIRSADALAASGAVTRRDVEAYRAAAVTAQSEADRIRAQYDVSRDQSAVTGAKRATQAAGLAQAEAAVARAQAAYDLARQDQTHTLIRAPIDGVVADRQAEPGDYVQPGARLLTVVPMRPLYVVANFKETQAARMTVGLAATIKVDALEGPPLKGVVESFAPGSGSQFSLLPFEPGTGNFTKIVQRVPVRIRLQPAQRGMERLRPGLSTTVKVRLAPTG